MDILSLPEDMLTIVLKKTSFSCLLAIRRMNIHCARIALKFDPNFRIEVSHVECFKLNRAPFFRWSDVKYTPVDPQLQIRTVHIPESKYFGHLHWIFAKVKCTGTLKVKECVFDIDVYESFANGVHFSWLKYLDLTEVMIASAEMAKILPRARRLNSLTLDDCLLAGMEKVLSNRRWLKLEIKKSDRDMNDSFLLNVVANCEEFATTSSSFTVLGVKALVNKILNNKNGRRLYKLGQIEENKLNTVERMHEIGLLPGVLIKETNHLEMVVVRYKITFDWDPNSSISLQLTNGQYLDSDEDYSSD